MGNFAFYEGYGGSQNKLGNDVSDAAGQSYNLTKPNPTHIPNDEARSVVLYNVRVGAVLSVYDNAEGKTDDDWCEIVVKRLVQQETVASFEETYENENVRVTYHRQNGLNGKVSHISVQ
jgi:hypothetical protein